MFKRFVGAAVMAGALVLGWGGNSYSSPPAGDAAAGKDAFVKKCKTCHGAVSYTHLTLPTICSV